MTNTTWTIDRGRSATGSRHAASLVRYADAHVRLCRLAPFAGPTSSTPRRCGHHRFPGTSAWSPPIYDEITHRIGSLQAAEPEPGIRGLCVSPDNPSTADRGASETQLTRR